MIHPRSCRADDPVEEVIIVAGRAQSDRHGGSIRKDVSIPPGSPALAALSRAPGTSYRLGGR
jgi:hypothetical protein